MLLFDLDGTLVPLATRPEQVRVPVATRCLLQKLCRKARIAVISGRRLSEVKALIGDNVDWIYGNHGFEMWARNEKGTPVAGVRPRGTVVARALDAQLGGFPGVDVENKGWTLAVHFRRAHGVDELRLYELVRKAVKPLAMEVSLGKKVLDIKPVASMNKGRAVGALLARHAGRRWHEKVAALYAGDDTTDEDAFAVLSGRGIGIKVGMGSTTASYRTRSPATRRGWLERLEGWI